MPLYLRGDTWYIDLRHGGRRIRRSAGTDDKREAQRKHDELAARAWKVRVHGKRLSDALHLWQTAEPRKPSSLRALKQIRKYYADRPIQEVNETSFQEVFGDKGAGTYNKLCAVLRASLRLAAARGWIDDCPDLGRRREPSVEPRYLTAKQWKTLCQELPPHLKAPAMFAVSTGLRQANVFGLTWDRVSLVRKTVWIPASTAKAGKTIAIPLSPAALAALRATGKGRTGVVFTYAGKSLRSPKTAWNKATKRAGLGGFRWHDLRHTWASWHAMGQTPLDVLQRLGGWQTASMVQRYAHLAPSYLAQFADNAKPKAA